MRRSASSSLADPAAEPVACAPRTARAASNWACSSSSCAAWAASASSCCFSRALDWPLPAVT
eukprot:1428464-Pleurochrysis_carterae.AAC.2